MSQADAVVALAVQHQMSQADAVDFVADSQRMLPASNVHASPVHAMTRSGMDATASSYARPKKKGRYMCRCHSAQASKFHPMPKKTGAMMN